MNSEEDPSLGTGEVEQESLPPAGVPVWVRCEGYRTMAYRDKDGLWRTVGDGKVLTGVIGMIKD
jgi:GH24 family phage-related lysozyme (muramidase)